MNAEEIAAGIGVVLVLVGLVIVFAVGLGMFR